MITTVKTKEYLRKQALEIRKNLALSGKLDLISSEIVSKISACREFEVSQNIAFYYPIKNEINLLALLKQRDKNFYFPRCIGSKMEFAKYEKNSLEVGKFGIMEPKNKAIEPKEIDFLLVPALAANSKGYRLGWGKGYYDRFICQNELKAKKAIVIPSYNLTDEFIQDDFDEKSDMIITEKAIYRI